MPGLAQNWDQSVGFWSENEIKVVKETIKINNVTVQPPVKDIEVGTSDVEVELTENHLDWMDRIPGKPTIFISGDFGRGEGN